MKNIKIDQKRYIIEFYHNNQLNEIKFNLSLSIFSKSQIKDLYNIYDEKNIKSFIKLLNEFDLSKNNKFIFKFIENNGQNYKIIIHKSKNININFEYYFEKFDKLSNLL